MAVAESLSKLRAAHRAFAKTKAALDEAAFRRDAAILEAILDGQSLRDVERETGCSRETIRRIARRRAATLVYVMKEDNMTEIFEITEKQTEVYAWKATGFGAGAFPRDVELLGVGEGWLPAAAELGSELDSVHRGELKAPIELTNEKAFALYQILRPSFVARPSRLADLADRLQERFGAG